MPKHSLELNIKILCKKPFVKCKRDFIKKLEMRSVERGICLIATSIMNELFQ